jgi:C4-dicarboxylate transporter DctQ subunit
VAPPTDRPDHWSGALNRLGEHASALGLVVAAAALLIIVVLNAANIMLRYVFSAAFPWAEEAMLYLMIFGVYAAAISVAWQQAHIRIDAFLNFASPAWRKRLDVLATLLMIAVLIPVVLASYRVVTLLFSFEQKSDALHLPIWIPQSVVPVALLLIVVMALLRLLAPRRADPGERMPPGTA